MSLHNWATEEFEMSNFKDKRLKNRFLKIAESFSKSPESSIPTQSNDWSETKAAYRFFKNENVDHSDFFCAHQAKTVKRASSYPYILAIQDTSLMSYNGHSNDNGMGRTRGTGRGFFLHSTIAVAPDGNFLGVLSNLMWARTEAKRKKINSRLQRKDGEERESYRWHESIGITAELLENKTGFISIADREADSGDFFLHTLDAGAEFIVRQKMSRTILNSENKSYEHIKNTPIKGSKDVFITNKHHVKRGTSLRVKDEFGKYERETTLYYQYDQIEICATAKDYSKDIKMNIVRIFEEGNHKDKIDWCLLTSLPIENLEDAEVVAKYYAIRWRIELFFKVMKSGCKAEKCRLSTFERMQKFVVLTTVIAWRISWLKYYSEQNPEDSAGTILSSIEKTIISKINKHEGELSISQALLWIAKLGGHLNRKNDGPPGFQTIWSGLMRLRDLEQGYLLFQ